MTTTVQQIQDRAVAFSSANGLSSLVSDTSEILSRVRADQQALYAGLLDQSGTRFQVTANLVSSSGSSGRTIALSSLSPPLARAISLTLASGQRAREVTIDDQDGRHPPRYYALGLSLVEVSNDWSAATGTVAATLVYAAGPTDIDPAGALTQLVSVPDEWTDLLVLPLAMYLVQKDVGRDADEYGRLERMQAGKLEAFTTYLANYSGDVSPEEGE